MRLFHGHMDECLTTSAPEQGEERRWGGPDPRFTPSLRWGVWRGVPVPIPSVSQPATSPQQRGELRGRSRLHPRSVPLAPGAPAHQVLGRGVPVGGGVPPYCCPHVTAPRGDPAAQPVGLASPRCILGLPMKYPLVPTLHPWDSSLRPHPVSSVSPRSCHPPLHCVPCTPTSPRGIPVSPCCIPASLVCLLRVPMTHPCVPTLHPPCPRVPPLHPHPVSSPSL